MKIQIFTATVIITLFSATSAWAGNEITATNDAKNSIAVGGNSLGERTNALGDVTTFGDSWNANNQAISGSIVMNGCECWDKMTLTNDSTNSLAVGYAGAGSIIIE